LLIGIFSSPVSLLAAMLAAPLAEAGKLIASRACRQRQIPPLPYCSTSSKGRSAPAAARNYRFVPH
jgi:hypothetical protein